MTISSSFLPAIIYRYLYYAVLQISPGGLSLPDKKYYFENENKVKRQNSIIRKCNN